MLSVRRTAYETLFPTAFSLYRLRGGTYQLATDPSTYTCAANDPGVGYDGFWQLFQGIPAHGSVNLTTSASGLAAWVFARPGPNVTSSGYNTFASFPSAGLLSLMFGDPAAGDQYQDPNTPLFNPVQFGIDAYGDALTNVTCVTHAVPPKTKQTTTNVIACQAGTS